MEKINEIAAIANDDSILLYNAVGITTFNISEIALVEKKIFELVNLKYKIIYVSEEIYKKIPETLEKYKMSVYPIIIPIPLNEESDGIGLKKIKENVEKAIGFDIF